jgi:hypothetical protein
MHSVAPITFVEKRGNNINLCSFDSEFMLVDSVDAEAKFRSDLGAPIEVTL